jgi:hypothetical protein
MYCIFLQKTEEMGVSRANAYRKNEIMVIPIKRKEEEGCHAGRAVWEHRRAFW